MGSHMKKSIFDEQTSKALKNWHMAVKKKKNRKTTPRSLGDASPTPSMSSMSSPMHSSLAVLHRFKTTGHAVLPLDGQDVSDTETDAPAPETATAKLIARVDYGDNDVETGDPHSGAEQQHQNEDDFSFVKPEAL